MECESRFYRHIEGSNQTTGSDLPSQKVKLPNCDTEALHSRAIGQNRCIEIHPIAKIEVQTC